MKNPNFFQKILHYKRTIDFVFQISEIMAANTLWEWSDSEDDELIRNINEEEILAGLNNDGDLIHNIDEGEWSNSEDDELIRNINEEEILARLNNDGDLIHNFDEGEWSNSEDDELIRNIDEDEILARLNDDGDPIHNIDEGEWSNSEDDELIRNINEEDILLNPTGDNNLEGEQTGRGEKRKAENQKEEQGQNYYQIKPVRKHHSKKFNTTAKNYSVRFNNVLDKVDLLESQKRTYAIFHHLIEGVTADMNPNDQVRFILSSDQLQTPIVIPFCSLEELTTEKVLSHVEKVVQSNEEFRLNNTVNIDLIRVEIPQGSGKSRVKRNIVDIRDYLKKKKSVIPINNKDNLCLARALAVSIARIEQDPQYNHIKDSRWPLQRERAFNLHEAANVPLGTCGLDEIELFQQHLVNYQIIVVSSDHSISIIYPTQPPANPDPEKSIYLFYHANHFDVITSLPGFLNKSHFCHRCHKPYDHTTDHMCTGQCRSCRGFGCVLQGDGILCNECDRVFKNQECYDNHKNPMNGGGKSVCDTIRICPKCGSAMDVRKIREGGHICGTKCSTCKVIYQPKDTDHLCYIQQKEHKEESSYNHLLFFDFECTQEHGIHQPNLCVVYDEEKEVGVFQGKDTVKEFCRWLLTPQHEGCIVIAHNFQGYDSYPIIKFLNENAIKYKVIYSGAKCVTLTIEMFDIKFIDSLNFIPMSLAKFPKTFAQPELCKGYFPHFFNKDENQDYVGPIPCQNDYGADFKKPGEREAFMTWHQEQVDNNYVFDFRHEILKYCRSDVDILAKCCLLYREMFKSKTGIDPFDKATTIASYCMQVYRTRFLEKDTIALLSQVRQLKAKQSHEALQWLSYTAEKEDIHIQHVRNGGEKRVGNYSLDGYCEETHTAYEYQGCYWHGKDFL